MKVLILALFLAACASQPVEAQLATACNSVASSYLTAAGYRAQGKLSSDAVKTLTSLEPVVLASCDKTRPPADLNAALTAITAAAQQLALINAGVK